jgi:tetratricopeptide (TPR) repeat protein
MSFWDRFKKSGSEENLGAKECLAEVERLLDRGDADGAIPIARRGLQRPVGEDADALMLKLRLAGMLRLRGDLKEARRHAEESLELAERFHGKQSRLSLSAWMSLGEIAMEQDDEERAFSCSEAAMEIAEQILPAESADFAAVLIQTSNFSGHIGELDSAEELLKSAWQILSALPDDQGYLFVVATNLAATYRAMGNESEAARWEEAAARLSSSPA